MKKLMIAIVLMIGLTSFAQRQNVRSGQDILTAEQRTELQVKKMALDLNLTAEQQRQLSEIVLKQQKDIDALKVKRAEAKSNSAKPSADDRFVMRKESLDRRIAFKQQVQKILTPAQFEKWQQKQDQRQARTKQHGKLKRLEKSKEISK